MGVIVDAVIPSIVRQYRGAKKRWRLAGLGRLPRFALRSLNGRFRRAPAATPVPSAVG
jgi:hypothetical protein